MLQESHGKIHTDLRKRWKDVTDEFRVTVISDADPTTSENENDGDDDDAISHLLNPDARHYLYTHMSPKDTHYYLQFSDSKVQIQR